MAECSDHDCKNEAVIGCFCRACYNDMDAPEPELVTEVQADGLIITYG